MHYYKESGEIRDIKMGCDETPHKSYIEKQCIYTSMALAETLNELMKTNILIIILIIYQAHTLWFSF